jgi:hypothetical protein
LAIAGTMNDDIPEEFRMNLMDNIKNKWDETH